MSYIRHYKTGTTQLCIPDPLPLGDEVSTSQDFYEVEAARGHIPSASTRTSSAVGLHIKHNHAALASAVTHRTTYQHHQTQPNGVSLLKRPNEMKSFCAPSSSKIPKLSAPSVFSSELMTINDAMLNCTKSVSKMSSLLTAKGLATPNKHVRDIPTAGWSPNITAVVEPQATQPSMSNHHPTKQTLNQSRPGHTVSTLERNNSVQWRHYNVGHTMYNPSAITTSPRYNVGHTTNKPSANVPYKPSFVPRAPPRYILIPNKPVTPVQLVRNKHHTTQNMNGRALPHNTHAIKTASCVPTGIPELHEPAVKEMNTHMQVLKQGNVSQLQTGAVRCISFETEVEPERLPLRDIYLDTTADLHTNQGKSAGVLPGDVVDMVRPTDSENAFEKVQNENVFELCDQLKDIKPYVISGWISSTYLLALMQKSNLVNEMFDNALDHVGDIRPEVVKNCRKTTPAILARDLVFRLFTLEELNGMNLKRLSRNKLWAIRRCVKKHFPDFGIFYWKKKCIPQIKSSLLTLFRHRVKHVQEFWLTHCDSEQVDSTKSA